MTAAIQTANIDAATTETVLIKNDLSSLSPDQRMNYYGAVCKSLGLNPLTQPFSYLTLNSKLVLYAKRDCTDQLRKINGISIVKLEREQVGDVYSVTAYARTANGREDSSIGAVFVGAKKGEDFANAMMKAETKAKRRVTLSISGLGMLDETEVETIPGIDSRSYGNTISRLDANGAISTPGGIVSAPISNGNGHAPETWASIVAKLRPTVETAQKVRETYDTLVAIVTTVNEGLAPYETKPASLAEAIARCADMAKDADKAQAVTQ